jgi:hypothetical protein
MRQALGDATRGETTPEALGALKLLAHELVSELRKTSQPPEQVLLQIKEILAEAGLRPNYATPEAPLGPEGVVYRDVIAWSIRSYYGEDPPPETKAL